MKVYIVTHGYYSDQAIAAVFSTQEKAEQFIQDTKDKGLVDYYHPYFNEFEVDKATLEWFEPHTHSGVEDSKEAYREITKLY
jgi:hypothetical protein